jgi:2,4-dienoyl-CoA reductase-like NADH-dependent reductase (Old Yellow Enzyme family)
MSTRTAELFSPLRLRSGEALRNRIAKAAMEEGMAGSDRFPRNIDLQLGHCRLTDDLAHSRH